MNTTSLAEKTLLTTTQKLMKSRKAFNETFTTFVKNYDLVGLIGFLERSAQEYPHWREPLQAAYNLFTARGLSSLAKECARIHVETCENLSAYGQQELGLPLMFNFLSGSDKNKELVDQAAYTKVLVELGRLKCKPVFPLTSNEQSEFIIAFSPYLEECFELISKPELAAEYLRDLSDSSPYAPLFYKLSNTHYGHNSNFFIDCYQELSAGGVNLHPFKLKDITIEKAKTFLKPYDVTNNDEFVVLYLRDDGYFDGPQEAHKKTIDPSDYIEAVKYFLSQGLKVMRLGHSKMAPMFDQPGFIDLTQVEKPDDVDIFLCGKANLYFGSGAGPASLAENFGVPCFESARVDYVGLRENSFAQYLTFEDALTSKKMMFSDVVDLGLRSAKSLEPFTSKNLIPCLPNSGDNLKFAKESLEYLEKGKIFHLNERHIKERKNFHLWGGLSSSTLPFLSHRNPRLELIK